MPARVRRTARLWTHLMGASLLILGSGMIIGGLAAGYLSGAFVPFERGARLSGALAVSRSFDHRVAGLMRSAAILIAADDAREHAGVGPRHHSTMTELLATLHVDGTLWRQTGESFSRQILSDGSAAPTPDMAPIAMKVASSGRMSLATAPAAERSGRLFVLSPLPAGLAPPLVLQVALTPPRLGAILSDSETLAGAEVRLIGPDGQILGGPDGIGDVGIEQLAAEFPGQANPAAASAREVEAGGGQIFSISYAALPDFPGWRVMLIERGRPGFVNWPMPTSEFVIAMGAAVLLALSAAAWIGIRLTRPLAALTAEFNSMASSDGLPPFVDSPPHVREFDELRGSLRRSTAVLRRRAAAERMALTEARTGHALLASVVTATDDLIYVKNLELRLLLANRATLSVGGVQREEWQVLGRFISEILPGEAAVVEEAWDRRVLAGCDSQSMRLDWPDARGGLRCLVLTKSPWRDSSGEIIGVVTVAHDVTAERFAEFRLAGVQADLLRVSRLSAMGAMASGLAHEVNQPLSAATNFLSAAARMLAGERDCNINHMIGKRDAARAAVADAAEQMLRAGDIVRRLRAFVSRGEAALRPEELGDVIREARELALVEGAATANALILREPGFGVSALADRTQLQQVLLNLIRNAAEAMLGSDEPRIEIAWDHSADGSARITVADNGPGVAPEVAHRLFEPFASTKRDGMGIGLAICRTIVEGHGGHLSASARDSGGTVFIIVLPLVRAPLDLEAGHVA